jgi:hypothetical protein
MLAYVSEVLMMVAVNTSEMLIDFYETTWCNTHNIPEYHHIQMELAHCVQM